MSVLVAMAHDQGPWHGGPAVIVLMGVAMAVIVIMVVAPRLSLISLHVSAALGIERRLERDDPRPKSIRHRLDDRIAADAQRLRQDFGRQMAVAEMPGDADQSEPVGGPDLRQRLGRGDDFDDAPVLEAQTVAAAQHRGFCEIEKEGEPADAGHGHAPAIALVKIEHHSIGRRAGPLAGGYHSVSTQHRRLSGLKGRVVGSGRPPRSTLNEKRSNASRPVSRVLYGRGSSPRRDGHSSGTPVAGRLKQPTRATGPRRRPCGA